MASWSINGLDHPSEIAWFSVRMQMKSPPWHGGHKRKPFTKQTGLSKAVIPVILKISPNLYSLWCHNNLSHQNAAIWKRLDALLFPADLTSFVADWPIAETPTVPTSKRLKRNSGPAHWKPRFASFSKNVFNCPRLKFAEAAKSWLYWIW